MSDIYWKANSFKYSKKTIDWYWIIWSISSLIIFSIYYFWEDTVFATMIFLLTILITLASLKKPKINKYSLHGDGIFMESNNRKINFNEIESYTIDSENLKILINTKNTIQPLIHIPFEATQNVSKIDNFLSTKIKKDTKLKIPLSELFINKIIGF